MLTPQQKHHYDQEGYLVLEDFKSPSEMAAIRERAGAIVDAFDPATRSVFTTRDQAMATDRYFLDSADQVCCFFEEDEFDESGRWRQAKAVSINKIGHALHDRDRVFDAFPRNAALAELAADLGLAQPLLWQVGATRRPPRELFVREGDHVSKQTLDTTPWPSAEQARALPVRAGNLVCFHGLLPHYRAPKRSSFLRHAYALHATDACTI